MNTTELRIDTGGRHVLDLTDRAAAFAAQAGTDGLLCVFVPHATAGLAVMETGSGSEEDLEEVLGRLLPRDDRWSHRHGSRGHGADHLLPVFAGPSLTVPVAGRPPPARHRAADLPGRPQRLQPPVPGAVQLPRRLNGSTVSIWSQVPETRSPPSRSAF